MRLEVKKANTSETKSKSKSKGSTIHKGGLHLLLLALLVSEAILFHYISDCSTTDVGSV
jgi:hypothetical protein